MMEADNLLVVCVDNDLKRTSVHITPSAIPCTATFEAASPVEVWSLWPCKSTCTEITGFYMTLSGLQENLV